MSQSPQPMDIQEQNTPYTTTSSTRSQDEPTSTSNASPASSSSHSIDRNLQASGTQRRYLRRGVQSPQMLQCNVSKVLLSIKAEDAEKLKSLYQQSRRTAASLQRKNRFNQAKIYASKTA